MKVTVDQDLCIACGTCIDLCPSVFDWDDEGLSHVIVDEVPEGAEDSCARESVNECPTEAIKEV
uniref:Ferredoxin n=1 Tax=Neomoorella thermoacetica TaxID=1525 RepID=FER_NEOTH|nr:RecName: Full=Ferredoxin [Moorella thermoacetica]